MEIPENIRKTLAYKCHMSITAMSSSKDLYDILDHYEKAGHMTNSRQKGKDMVLFFNDNSALLIRPDKGKKLFEMSVLDSFTIMALIHEYFPFKEIANAYVEQDNGTFKKYESA